MHALRLAGGIDDGEEPQEAALREVTEETSIKSARIVGEIDRWLHYDFPTKARAQRGRVMYRQWSSVPNMGAAWIETGWWLSALSTLLKEMAVAASEVPAGPHACPLHTCTTPAPWPPWRT